MRGKRRGRACEEGAVRCEAWASLAGEDSRWWWYGVRWSICSQRCAPTHPTARVALRRKALDALCSVAGLSLSTRVSEPTGVNEGDQEGGARSAGQVAKLSLACDATRPEQFKLARPSDARLRTTERTLWLVDAPRFSQWPSRNWPDAPDPWLLSASSWLVLPRPNLNCSATTAHGPWAMLVGRARPLPVHPSL